VEPSAPDHREYLNALDLFDDMPCRANQNSSARARRVDRFAIFFVFSQTGAGNRFLRCYDPPVSSLEPRAWRRDAWLALGTGTISPKTTY
jgi:hypothetical protein